MDWQPMETAPKEGRFLVYMPTDKRQSIQVAKWHPNVKVIGNVFAFDAQPPTHWMPLPAPPQAAIEGPNARLSGPQRPARKDEDGTE